jgi:hypothetical protein
MWSKSSKKSQFVGKSNLFLQYNLPNTTTQMLALSRIIHLVIIH